MASSNIQATHNKPGIDIKTARICCEETSKEFEAHSNNLKILFVVSGIQDAKDSLIEKQSELLNLPQGQEIFNRLKKHLEDEHANSEVIGILSKEQKILMGLKSVTQNTALINVNAASHADKHSLQMELYAQTWKALSIIDDIENEIEDTLNKKDNLTTSKWNNLHNASRNMFADIFAGSLAELKGQKGALRSLAKKRAIACFEDLKSYDAKSNPFPIMLEAAQMIYDDINDASEGQKDAITLALNIASEAIETTDENSILQWQSFIESAREMAWADLSISQILGTAIYTSDNVYNRSSAYMIAEILNTDPAPVIEFDGYNAFADIESQQRSHKIACLETLEYVQSRQIEKANSDSFYKMAEQSCQMLLEGKPNGFCAPAMTIAGQHIKKTPDITKEALSKIVTSQINALPWAAIRDLHKTITDLRKNDRCNGLNSIVEVLRQDEDTRDSAILVKELSDMINSD